MFVREPERSTPIFAEPEVLVVGAGPAGIGAAVAAARNGAEVLLVERYGFPGGNLTAAMVNPMLTFHDVHGRQVIQGVAGELVMRLTSLGASPGHVTDLTFDNASMTPYDPEGMKQVLLDLLEEAGVGLLFHATVVDVVTRPPLVYAVIVEGKSGRLAIRPKVVLDCSGDADVAAYAGAPYVKGRASDGAMQPVSLFFRLGGVDFPRLRQWMKDHRHLLKDDPSDGEIDQQEALAFLGLGEQVKVAAAGGEFPTDAAPRILFYQLPREGQVAVNVTRQQGIDGTDIRDLTRAEVLTRRQAWAVYQFLKRHIGGFEASYIVDTAVQVGVRETRHIIGDYTLTEQDVLEGRSFADGIACGTFAIDIHPPEGTQQVFTGSGRAVYEIPYRCLLPQGYNNLLVAGRSISATHAAFGSTRVMATCLAIGQGAGTAAAQIARLGCTARQVDTPALRRLLVEQGQYLLNAGAPEVIAPDLQLRRASGSGARAGHHNPFSSEVAPT